MTPFEWTDYLQLAQILATRMDNASRRSAVSRAYYACYGIAARYALSHDFAHTVVTHDRVWGWYRHLDDPIGREINILGKRIKEHRIAADYQADDARVAQRAIMICDWAGDLVALLRALPDDLESSLEPDVSPER